MRAESSQAGDLSCYKQWIVQKQRTVWQLRTFTHVHFWSIGIFTRFTWKNIWSMYKLWCTIIHLTTTHGQIVLLKLAAGLLPSLCKVYSIHMVEYYITTGLLCLKKENRVSKSIMKAFVMHIHTFVKKKPQKTKQTKIKENQKRHKINYNK